MQAKARVVAGDALVSAVAGVVNSIIGAAWVRMVVGVVVVVVVVGSSSVVRRSVTGMGVVVARVGVVGPVSNDDVAGMV